ncbi:hypothetical protein RF11_15325 [Thelohanellus kitauei]|uniref:Uncharacterized protein n=1 Tax=Thelohanellus kitauei TaxID=669202 RepID=A0A0C2IJ28_THEKT|nr:hypothetical protein RF11_15325 [Thelohanellus kitauei]
MSDNLTTQTIGVKYMMFEFWHQRNLKADLVFIQHFPKLLYEEFNRISKGQADVENCQSKKHLLFEIFTFVFRNKHMELFKNPKFKSLVVFFLIFIKTHDRVSIIFLETLIDSINRCVSYEPYNVMFIEENAMFNFYYYFSLDLRKTYDPFLDMCRKVYNDDLREITKFNDVKLTTSMKIIMSKFVETRDTECITLFFMFLKIINRLKLLCKVEFNACHLFEITKFIFLRDYHQMNYMFRPNLSILWIHILNEPENTFRIDAIENLIIFTALFSIHLHDNLKYLITNRINIIFNKNKKQILYVVYFTLVAFPIIDHPAKPWLRKMLKRLHFKFGEYFEKFSVKIISMDNRFHILQYYFKSLATLNIDISCLDEKVFEDFLNELADIPSFSTFN